MRAIQHICAILIQRRDAYIDFWARFRDACCDDAEMRERIDAFFIAEINKIEKQIADMQQLLCDMIDNN